MKRILPIAKFNVERYGKPPTWTEIESLLKEVGINKYKFELFYGIPYKILEKVKTGSMDLPPAYWHIFYEKIKLNYGVGFEGVYEKLYGINNIPKTVRKKVPKRFVKIYETSENHDRTATLV